MPFGFSRSDHRSRLQRRDLRRLVLGALGVVYGDIGTSPLYAIKECFQPIHGIAPTTDNILGVLSLVSWSLILVVFVKYVGYIMRADNHGEGGIMALIALVSPLGKSAFLFAGIFGAALLYGDGMITPAISVMGAMEGLKQITPHFDPWIVPLTLVIILLFFMAQKRGTHRIGSIFGPLMLIWFLTIIAIGIPWIVKRPEILLALHPGYGIRFLVSHGLLGFGILSAVVLCITGAEALYADMGHFGAKPIKFALYLVVFPALFINYFGQGALILEKGFVENPFFSLVGGHLIYPLVGIGTLAAIIASQALISGAFSLTHQAMQLGYLPRINIIHTSRSTEGQIYVPAVNWMLMVSCVLLILGFRSSTGLASAYGIAVTGTMMATNLLFFTVCRQIWKWSLSRTALIVSVFVVIDGAFLASNLSKIWHGGWVPLAIAVLIYMIMTTWKKGRLQLSKGMLAFAIPLDQFFADIRRKKPPRVKGAAVFMSLNRDIAPSVLLHHFKHNQVLHETVILLSIQTEHRPETSVLEQVRITELEEGFYNVVSKFGYMQTPNVPRILERCRDLGLKIKPDEMSFYLGRETLLVSGKSELSRWRKVFFSFLSKNARPATIFFGLPPDRVIEIGTQVEI